MYQRFYSNFIEYNYKTIIVYEPLEKIYFLNLDVNINML